MIQLNRYNFFIRFYITLYSLLIISCQNRSEQNIEFDEVAFIINTDIENDIEFFSRNISIKEDDLDVTNKYKTYKNITNEYINYLEELKQFSLNMASNPFFEKEEVTDVGKKYMKKSVQYKDEVNYLFSDDYLSEQVEILLGLNDVITQDDIYVRYIYYYFYGLPKDLFIYKINIRKRNVLIIQNEILYSALLEQCKVVN